MVLARWRNGRLASWKVSNTLTRDVKVVISRRVRLPVRQVTVVLCEDAQNWRVYGRIEAPRRYGNDARWFVGDERQARVRQLHVHSVGRPLQKCLG